MECFKCGVEGDKARLFDAVGSEGIVNICEKCAEREDMPIIRKPSDFQLKEASRKGSVYERLSKAAGLDPKVRAKVSEEQKQALLKQETSLRDIIDKNVKFDFESKKEIERRDDLIDNFHWIIMRVRRRKQISAEKLAREIGESANSVKMAEQGIIPPENDMLVHKLENALGIKLFKKEFVDQPARRIGESRVEFEEDPYHEEKKGKLGFDNTTSKSLTIADIKAVEKSRQGDIFKSEKESVDEIDVEEYEQGINLNQQEELESGEENKEDDLDDKDMTDMIFRRE